MRSEPLERLRVARSDDVSRVRQAARIWAIDLGFGLVDQTRIVTAASELARNQLLYAGGGAVEAEIVESDGRRGLKMTFLDQGPGIPDVELALQDGFSARGHGLGLGLGGSRRLMDDFSIVSEVGKGTTVTTVKWR